MFIEIDDINYHVHVRGEGKPLVCLHGFAENKHTWDGLNLDGYAIYSFDMIGHGKTNRYEKAPCYDFDYLLESLHKLFQKLLPNQKFSLLGYSMGGRIAIRYALKYQEKIDALLLESAGHGIICDKERQERAKSDEILAFRIEEKGMAWFADFWGNIPLFESQKRLNPNIQKKIKERRLANNCDALAQNIRSLGQAHFPCLLENLKSIHRPTLYISGGLDTKYCAIGGRYARAISHLQHHIIEHVGHNTHLEDSYCFNQIVQDFLDANRECF